MSVNAGDSDCTTGLSGHLFTRLQAEARAGFSIAPAAVDALKGIAWGVAQGVADELGGTDEAWQALSLGSGWLAHDAGNPPRYRAVNVGGLKIVFVEGLARNTVVQAVGVSIVTGLPAGYRPRLWHFVPTFPSANISTPIMLEVQQSGAIVLYASGASLASGAWVDLHTSYIASL